MIQKTFKTVLTILAALLLVTVGAQAAVYTVAGSLNAGSPTFNRTTDRAGFPDSANNAVPYEVVEIRTGASAGTLTVTVDGAITVFDSFLALYSTPFTLANRNPTLITADDDTGGYPHAKLTSSGLAANTSYWLVVASYSGAAGLVYPRYGAYKVTLNFDGGFASYAITTTAIPAAGGSVSCTSNPVIHGSGTTCTATANAGYIFGAFSGDCAGATCLLSNVTSAKSVSANFVVSAPGVTFNPALLSFTSQVIASTSAAKTVTLTNTGNAPLTISNIASANSVFGVTHDCTASLAASASCTLNVTFRPAAAVTTSSSIVVTDNATGSPHALSVSGVGVASNAPVCTLSAAPASVPRNGTSTLTASCSPEATSYTWTGGTCAGSTASSCIVSPAVTTTYGVTGTNSFGANSAAITVTVKSADLTPILMLLLD